MPTPLNRPAWTQFKDVTKDDVLAMEAADRAFNKSLPERVLAHLKQLEPWSAQAACLPISRYEHCLQSATLAYRDGREVEYVVCALLHDIGDVLCPFNHADIAADLLKPFVSEKNHWMIAKHAVFQGYYFFHHLSADRHARDHYKAHPYYAATAEFAERYDQAAFHPRGEILPLEFFEPMVRTIFSRTPNWMDEQNEADGATSGTAAQAARLG